MMKANKFIENYWMILAVGIYFILTGIYNCYGSGRSVEWNTFIKTTRELFLIILLLKHKSNLNNTISVLFCYGMISLSLSYTIFRLYCAFKSSWDYNQYWELMKDVDLRFMLTIIIFVILLLIKYLNRK